MLPKTSRQWDELACPECGAENVVITQDAGQYISGQCAACGKDVLFERDPWNSRFIEKIKERRKYDPGLPGGR